MPKRNQVPRKTLTDYICQSAKKNEVLLVEGAGGLMSPLGTEYHLGHVIEDCRPQVVITAPNKLGVLNQVLLNVTYLKSFMSPQNIHVVLMGRKNADLSVKTNGKLLKSWINDVTVLELPYLGANAKSRPAVQQHAGRYNKLLAKALNFS